MGCYGALPTASSLLNGVAFGDIVLNLNIPLSDQLSRYHQFHSSSEMTTGGTFWVIMEDGWVHVGFKDMFSWGFRGSLASLACQKSIHLTFFCPLSWVSELIKWLFQLGRGPVAVPFLILYFFIFNLPSHIEWHQAEATATVGGLNPRQRNLIMEPSHCWNIWLSLPSPSNGVLCKTKCWIASNSLLISYWFRISCFCLGMFCLIGDRT